DGSTQCRDCEFSISIFHIRQQLAENISCICTTDFVDYKHMCLILQLTCALIELHQNTCLRRKTSPLGRRKTANKFFICEGCMKLHLFDSRHVTICQCKRSLSGKR